MSSSNFPNQVLIIRHGEKLGESSSDKDGGPDLSMRGSSRAAALPSLFAPVDYAKHQLSCALAAGSKAQFGGTYNSVAIAGVVPRFATPDFIFATKASTDSNRPVETITPLAQALNLTPDDKHSNEHYDKVATDILTNAKYAGKVVLICWHHGNIAALAQCFGIASPPPWPGTVFDWVWQITWPGNTATLNSSLRQMLLYGDSN
jgi:hypothetical protein